MTSVFSWLVGRLGRALGAILVVQALFMLIGLRLVLDSYSAYQEQRLLEQARNIILRADYHIDENQMPHSPFFVFSADKELLYTNRGKGKSIPLESLTPIYWQDTIAGYAYTGDLDFFTSAANQRFIMALGILFVVSLCASLGIGFMISRASVHTISEPVLSIRKSLQSLVQHRIPEEQSFSLQEFNDISSDIHTVGCQLSDAVTRQTQFLQDLAHDLRTPLAGIRSQAEAIADGVLTPSPDRMKRVIGEIDRIEGLLSKLTELFQAESLTAFEYEEIELAEIGQILEHRFSSELSYKNIQFNLSLTIPRLYANKALLIRALSNIVDNSLKYCPNNSIITLGSNKSNNQANETIIELWIEDTGPGIHSSDLERIFDRLYRAEFSRNSPGSGLGLSIVKAIAHAHGARVHAQNIEEHGLRVCISFGLNRYSDSFPYSLID